MSRGRLMIDMVLNRTEDTPEPVSSEAHETKPAPIDEYRKISVSESGCPFEILNLPEDCESGKGNIEHLFKDSHSQNIRHLEPGVPSKEPLTPSENSHKAVHLQRNIDVLNERFHSRSSESNSDIDFSPDESEYVPSPDSESTDTSDPDKNFIRENSNLEGMEECPQITIKPRKRKRQPKKMVKKINKSRRALGKEYVGARKVAKPKMEMGPPCGSNCKRKCNITNEKREDIFNTYWAMGNYTRQRDFIHSNTDKMKTKTKTTASNSRREFTCNFFLPSGGERIQVCKKMFLNTLGIKKGVVDIALKKRSSINTSLGDGRGRHTKKILPAELKAGIKTHIESFPVVPSHYCRSDTERKYLHPDLNIRIMYRLYVKWCDDKNQLKAKESAYRNFFNNEYNMRFHRPQKDQCRICTAFDKGEIIPDYQDHIKKKNLAKDEKIKDKDEAAQSEGKTLSINFDLQQVLMSPNDPKNNSLFYKRRLTSYNFTIYDVASKKGICFMWHECEGGRGSSEIASCLFQYFQTVSKDVDEIRCFSDRCGGQNLNQFVAGMCMYAVTILNIKSIDLKFLTSGHSEMECDSMHSAIGTEFKRVGKAYWRGDWKTIARSARKKGDKPYDVIDNIVFKDWKNFVQTNLNIRKKDTTGEPVQWQKMSWIKFEASLPYCFKFKENFDDEEFRVVDCSKTTRQTSINPLQALYKTPKSISKVKYDDLMSLFSSKPPAVSRDYYNFYANLPDE